MAQARTRKPQSNRAARRASRPEGPAPFNADEQVEILARAVITIGGQEFHRRLKDHAVSREARDITVAQQRLNVRIEQIEKELIENDDVSLEEREEREDEAIELSDEAIELTYKFTAALLVDKEGKPPTLDLLKTRLDYQILAELNRELEGGEPAVGPTQTATS
jgi:hypothetical protein